jgi:hypothetical protein
MASTETPEIPALHGTRIPLPNAAQTFRLFRDGGSELLTSWQRRRRIVPVQSVRQTTWCLRCPTISIRLN